MDFDVSSLFYVISIPPPSSRNESNLFTNIVEAALTSGSKEARLQVGTSNVYIYPYRPQDAKRDIDWALDY